MVENDKGLGWTEELGEELGDGFPLRKRVEPESLSIESNPDGSRTVVHRIAGVIVDPPAIEIVKLRE